MRKTTPTSIVLALSLSLTGVLAHAQMKTAVPQKSPLVSSARQQSASTFQRISQADAFKLYRENKAVFIDVRSNGQFTLGHIKGATSIPGSQVVSRFAEITPGKVVVTYCACTAEQSSGLAATNLINHGVKNVFALKGGFNDWKANRYPIAAGPK